MSIKGKRSLIGYDPAWVEKKVNSSNLEFEKTLKELEQELFAIIHENEELKDKIQVVRDEIAMQQVLEAEISNTLLGLFMDSTQTVLNTSYEVEQAEMRKLEMVSYKEKIHVRLKKNLRNLIEEIQTTVEGYRFKLDLSEYNKEGEFDEQKIPRPQQTASR